MPNEDDDTLTGSGSAGKGAGKGTPTNPAWGQPLADDDDEDDIAGIDDTRGRRDRTEDDDMTDDPLENIGTRRRLFDPDES